MGTIAARDCLRVLELTEQVAAAHTLATVQAVMLRRRDQDGAPLPERLRVFVEAIAERSAFVVEDRPLESDLRELTAAISRGHLPLPADINEEGGHHA